MRSSAHSPIDAGKAMALARDAGINVVEREGDPWDDVHTLAEDGPDAFKEPVREGPASGEDLAAEDPGTFYLREISRTPLLNAEEEVEHEREPIGARDEPVPLDQREHDPRSGQLRPERRAFDDSAQRRGRHGWR